MSSQAKQTKYFEKAGSCFNHSLGNCASVLPKQFRDGYYHSLHFVDKETTGQKG